MAGKKSGKVSVVLVNYNGRKYLRSCIESIREQSYPDISVIVVDNCSVDDSIEFLKSQYPEIKVIAEKENTGFARGNNIGIRAAMRQGAEYVLLLNVDTAIDPFLVERLLEEADCRTVTVPKIYSDKRKMKVWYAGGGMDYEKGRSFHRDLSGQEEVKQIEFACGCCMLVHRMIFQFVGGFDEKYYLYFEDTDYSMRLKKAGISIRYVPGAVMWHKEGGSGGRDGLYLKKYYFVRNQLYFIHKYKGDFQTNVIRTIDSMIRKEILKSGDRKMAKYAWCGIWDFLNHRMYKKR